MKQKPIASFSSGVLGVNTANKTLITKRPFRKQLTGQKKQKMPNNLKAASVPSFVSGVSR